MHDFIVSFSNSQLKVKEIKITNIVSHLQLQEGKITSLYIYICIAKKKKEFSNGKGLDIKGHMQGPQLFSSV